METNKIEKKSTLTARTPIPQISRKLSEEDLEEEQTVFIDNNNNISNGNSERSFCGDKSSKCILCLADLSDRPCVCCTDCGLWICSECVTSYLQIPTTKTNRKTMVAKKKKPSAATGKKNGKSKGQLPKELKKTNIGQWLMHERLGLQAGFCVPTNNAKKALFDKFDVHFDWMKQAVARGQLIVKEASVSAYQPPATLIHAPITPTKDVTPTEKADGKSSLPNKRHRSSATRSPVFSDTTQGISEESDGVLSVIKPRSIQKTSNDKPTNSARRTRTLRGQVEEGEEKEQSPDGAQFKKPLVATSLAATDWTASSTSAHKAKMIRGKAAATNDYKRPAIPRYNTPQKSKQMEKEQAAALKRKIEADDIHQKEVQRQRQEADMLRIEKAKREREEKQRKVQERRARDLAEAKEKAMRAMEKQRRLDDIKKLQTNTLKPIRNCIPAPIVAKSRPAAKTSSRNFSTTTVSAAVLKQTITQQMDTSQNSEEYTDNDDFIRSEADPTHVNEQKDELKGTGAVLEEKPRYSPQPAPLPVLNTSQKLRALAALNSSAQASHSVQDNRSQNYEITPCRLMNPSTANDYNIADLDSGDETDNEDSPRKSIPFWATKRSLKVAMMHQMASKVDVDELFGRMQEPDLSLIFEHKRNRFFHRTSSAQWNSPIWDPTRAAKTRMFERPASDL